MRATVASNVLIGGGIIMDGAENDVDSKAVLRRFSCMVIETEAWFKTEDITRKLL